ncbi:hypothetical protein N7444_006357 [Penicillium canescens]|nr:hypothetical protein N7444_006357 [Penicillium canescens]
MTLAKKYDILVVGGGTAGIGAAIGARQAAGPHARILMVESKDCLGGAATHRGVVAYCGLFTLEELPKRAIGRIWEDLERRLKEIDGTTGRPVRHCGIFQALEPECLKLVLDDIVLEHHIDVLLHATVVGARCGQGQIVSSVELQERSGRRWIEARAFVDCSGDGDLAYHCSASTLSGNHGTVNLGSLATCFVGLDSSAKPTAASWRQAIIAAKMEDPALLKVIRKNESVLIRLPQSGHVVSFLASATYDTRDAASITAAEVSGRKQAREYLKSYENCPAMKRCISPQQVPISALGRAVTSMHHMN